MTSICSILALSDAAQWTAYSVQILFNAVLAYAVFTLNQRAQKVAKLEDRFSAAAADLVEQRARAMSQQCEFKHGAVNRELAEMRVRLDRSDAEFRQVIEQRQQLEVKLLAKFEQLKDFLHKEMATKEDLRNAIASVEGK